VALVQQIQTSVQVAEVVQVLLAQTEVVQTAVQVELELLHQ
jgi:hypothetical protein